VLDAGCGPGCVGVDLCDCFDVTLVDCDPDMVHLSRSLALAKGELAARVHQLDWQMVGEYYPDSFDAVICCGNSFGRLLDEVCRVGALRSFAASLRPGGIIYLDYWLQTHEETTSWTLAETYGPFEWQSQSLVVQVYEKCAPQISAIRRRKICYGKRNGVTMELVVTENKYACITRSQIESELRLAGFFPEIFCRRPGGWPMPAIVARKVNECRICL
jgi:SAM-dependent methyltransferase